jgi:hypothetical protein
MSGLSHAGSIPLSRDQARAVFGQVMGLVALTLGCLALGAYIGRDLSGGWGILFFIAGFACIVGLNIASARGNEQLATTLLRQLSEDAGSPIARDHRPGARRRRSGIVGGRLA